jgi:hypothetical protein
VKGDFSAGTAGVFGPDGLVTWAKSCWSSLRMASLLAVWAYKLPVSETNMSNAWIVFTRILGSWL